MRVTWRPLCRAKLPIHAPAADAAKVKTYPRIDLKDDKGVTILVGHVVVTTGISEQGKGKVKAEDLAKWLETVDFSSIEK